MRKDGRFLEESILTSEQGEKLSEMALGWLLAHKEVTSVLIEASRPQQILDNIKVIHCAPFTEEEPPH